MASLIPEPLIHPHWEYVSDQLQDIITSIGQEPSLQNFYLAGGTALALQLGHRISVDLDFFSAEDELLDESRQNIIAKLQRHLTFEIVQNVVGSLLLNVGGVAVGFFSYQYPLLTTPLLVSQVKLAGLLDIGLMKMDAVASRGVKKDFYDLYFIAQQLPLDEILEHSQTKYPYTRDFGIMVLEALVDFSIADQQAPIQTHPPIEWATVQAFCQQEVQRLGHIWFEQGE